MTVESVDVAAVRSYLITEMESREYEFSEREPNVLAFYYPIDAAPFERALTVFLTDQGSSVLVESFVLVVSSVQYSDGRTRVTAEDPSAVRAEYQAMLNDMRDLLELL